MFKGLNQEQENELKKVASDAVLEVEAVYETAINNLPKEQEALFKYLTWWMLAMERVQLKTAATIAKFTQEDLEDIDKRTKQYRNEKDII